MRAIAVVTTAIFGISLLACTGEPIPPTAETCKDICAQASTTTGTTTGTTGTTSTTTGSTSGASSAGMSAFEQGLVGPVLDEVRAGVQPWDDKSVGICKGSGKDCEEWLGTTVTEPLPEGEYMLRAELKVPRVGEKGTWKVKFDTECITTKTTGSGESKTTSTNSKEYEVQYVGDERGSRLSPLYKITSPKDGASQSCTWKLTGLHADKPTEWTGSWTVPQKP